MHDSRTAPVAAAALLALLVPVVAGCSSSGSSSTTTRAPATTQPSTTSTTFGPGDLPATGSVDGYTMAVHSSPKSGTVGQTTITVVAVLTGKVVAATLHFQVSDSASAATGKPATDQQVQVTGPGTFTIPKAFSPPTTGSWATTVVYLPKSATTSKLTVSGLPPVAGASAPFPQLVTTVTG
jgi:hypothetical protein